MKESKPSRTAKAVAFIRAAESYLPENKRMFTDPFAKRFLNPFLRLLAEGHRLPGLRNLCNSLLEHSAGIPGIANTISCRTITIDNALRDALHSGCSQIVNLGAGYDSRAYRIPGAEKTIFFEIDQPATLEYKRKIIGKIVGQIPSHVKFVPLNLAQEDLLDKLQQEGFNAKKKTFYIMEGVTPYIPVETVDKVLRFVVNNSAVGSRIIFTYFIQGAIDGSWKETEKHARKVAQAGEPWVFGLAPEVVAEFLIMRDLSLIEDLYEPEYRVRYFEPRGRVGPIAEFEHTVLAEV